MIDTSEEDSFFPEQSLFGEIKDAFHFFTDTVFNELHCITCTDKFTFQHPSSDKSSVIDPIKVYQRIEEARQLCLRQFTQTLTKHNIEKTPSIDHSSPFQASSVISEDEDDNQILIDEPSSDEKPITQMPFRVITQHLKCFVGKCRKLVKSKESLNGHLLRRHDIQPFRCKVHRCKASFQNAFVIPMICLFFGFNIFYFSQAQTWKASHIGSWQATELALWGMWERFHRP